MRRVFVALWAVLLFALGANYSGAAPTLSGKSLSMTSMSTGSSVKSSIQSIPASSGPVKAAMKMASVRTSSVSPSVVVAPSVVAPVAPPAPGPGTTTGTAPLTGYSVVEDRPDFSYRPTALKFIQQPTFTTGQIGMGIGPGLPAGTVRYVPVGEF